MAIVKAFETVLKMKKNFLFLTFILLNFSRTTNAAKSQRIINGDKATMGHFPGQVNVEIILLIDLLIFDSYLNNKFFRRFLCKGGMGAITAEGHW